MSVEPATGQPPAGTTANGGATKKRLSSPLFLLPATALLAAALFVGLNYLFTAMTHESTDDAFIAGHISSVAPRVSGQVIAVHVSDNQLVHSNDVLVEIDPADCAMILGQKTSAADSQDASYKAALESYKLMETKVATAQAAARKAQADLEASTAAAKLAAANFARSETLLKDKTISPQEFDAAQAANNSAQASLNSAQENLAEQNSKVNEAQAVQKAAQAQVSTALAQWNEAKTNVEAARLNLSYTKICAPTTGRVTRKQVERGDYLATGQQILSVVPNNVWVLANFKESQLEHMKPGQPVKVEIDALGGREFSAHVDSVQAGSGAQFSLFPPENATGNFVKVIQRVPVKIVFDEPLPEDHVIGPGLSVVPSVKVSQFVFPRWGTAAIALVMAALCSFTLVLVTGRKPAGK